MRRNKQTTLPIGSISSGTLRMDDLLPALIDVLADLRLTRAERATLRAIDTRANLVGYYDSADCGAEDDYQELCDIADQHCPAYCYFGSHPGDGADIGVWIVEDLFSDIRQGSYDGDVFRGRENMGPGESDVPADYGYFLAVNDHGNATLYRRSGRAWREVWAVV